MIDHGVKNDKKARMLIILLIMLMIMVFKMIKKNVDD